MCGTQKLYVLISIVEVGNAIVVVATSNAALLSSVLMRLWRQLCCSLTDPLHLRRHPRQRRVLRRKEQHRFWDVDCYSNEEDRYLLYTGLSVREQACLLSTICDGVGSAHAPCRALKGRTDLSVARPLGKGPFPWSLAARPRPRQCDVNGGDFAAFCSFYGAGI